MNDSSTKISKIVLFDIDYTIFDTAKFKSSNLTSYNLYHEIKTVFKEISKFAMIGILSEGEKEFQKIKLRKTDIFHLFKSKDIHIVSNKLHCLKHILNQYSNKKIYIVDDKLPILYAVKNLQPLTTTIWVKRGIYAERQDPIPNFFPDAEIENLDSIVKIINA